MICADADEAHYLMAIINSAALEDAVEPFRPTGRFCKGGARDLHKHLWKLPIPRCDPSNASHAASSQTVAKTRRELREWQRENAMARAIEGAVAGLLGAGG